MLIVCVLTFYKETYIWYMDGRAVTCLLEDSIHAYVLYIYCVHYRYVYVVFCCMVCWFCNAHTVPSAIYIYGHFLGLGIIVCNQPDKLTPYT